MHIISHRKIKEFYELPGNGDSRIALERWYDIAQQAQWHNLSEIREDFPATDYVGNQHYVFNIKGNDYRLVAMILFAAKKVFIRWIGTHKEYDNKDCSNA